MPIAAEDCRQWRIRTSDNVSEFCLPGGFNFLEQDFGGTSRLAWPKSTNAILCPPAHAFRSREGDLPSTEIGDAANSRMAANLTLPSQQSGYLI